PFARPYPLSRSAAVPTNARFASSCSIKARSTLANLSQTLKVSSPGYRDLRRELSMASPAVLPQHDLSSPAYRTIVFAPIGKDAYLIAEMLERRGLSSSPVSSITGFCDEIRRGAGAAILAEEALRENSMREILRVLEDQPSWSDFPLILLTTGGRVTLQSERLREFRRPLGNLFLLERPIRPETLLGTLEIALRGRRRQYQIHDQMLQYANAQEALLRSEKLAVTGRLAASIAHEINN